MGNNCTVNHVNTTIVNNLTTLLYCCNDTCNTSARSELLCEKYNSLTFTDIPVYKELEVFNCTKRLRLNNLVVSIEFWEEQNYVAYVLVQTRVSSDVKVTTGSCVKCEVVELQLQPDFQSLFISNSTHTDILLTRERVIQVVNSLTPPTANNLPRVNNDYYRYWTVGVAIAFALVVLIQSTVLCRIRNERYMTVIKQKYIPLQEISS